MHEWRRGVCLCVSMLLVALLITPVIAQDVPPDSPSEESGTVGPDDAMPSDQPAPAYTPTVVPQRTLTATAGTILLTDDFDDPARGRLPRVSREPERFTLGYLGGEYQIRTIESGAGSVWVASVPGTHSDASLSVAVRIVEDATSRYATLSCRTGPSGRGYRMTMLIGDQIVRIERSDGSSPVILSEEFATSIRSNSANRFELVCAGNMIWTLVNGTPVSSVEDDTYDSGGMWIGAGAIRGAVDARFDNLVVTQHDASEAPPAVVSSTSPGESGGQPNRLILSDNFDDPERSVLPRTSPDPSRALVRHEQGEYILHQLDPASGSARVSLPGTYGDATFEIDVRITQGNGASLVCRSGADGVAGYSITIDIAIGFYYFRTNHRSTRPQLITGGFLEAINRGTGSNKLSLSCVGNRITASVNNVQVGSTEDNTYRRGSWWILAGFTDDSRQPVFSEARFDNLILAR